MSRYRYIVSSLLAPFFLFGSAGKACAWGGRLHVDISRRATQIVPGEMAGWREYQGLLGTNSYRPDLWKDGDPAEGVRHFIDAESYERIGLTNLPPQREQALQMLGSYGSGAHGAAPWVILDLQEKLAQAMRSNEWALAARIAAAQGHYVADLHQPLHTTKNYDGSSGEGAGVHLRWEVQMPAYHWRTGFLTVSNAFYITNVWALILEWAATAHERYPFILEADAKARAASHGNVESRRYYETLWDLTQSTFVEQANAAAEHLASLWYTAWISAGKPPIPAPPERISEASIWLEVGRPQEPSAMPFFIAFVAVALLIIYLCARKERTAHPSG